MHSFIKCLHSNIVISRSRIWHYLNYSGSFKQSRLDILFRYEGKYLEFTFQADGRKNTVYYTPKWSHVNDYLMIKECIFLLKKRIKSNRNTIETKDCRRSYLTDKISDDSLDAIQAEVVKHLIKVYIKFTDSSFFTNYLNDVCCNLLKYPNDQV
jgi:hypothetical protein